MTPSTDSNILIRRVFRVTDLASVAYEEVQFSDLHEGDLFVLLDPLGVDGSHLYHEDGTVVNQVVGILLASGVVR